VIYHQQPSGLAVLTLQSPANGISLNDFFGLNQSGLAPSGLSEFLTQTNVYGFTSDANLENFMYSAKIDCKFVIPRANLTGTLYQGKLRLGQFFSSTATTSAPTVTLSSLIRGADTVKSMQEGFTLQSALVNDYILSHTLKTGVDTLTDYLKDVDLGSEIIDYVVLQNPSISVTGGSSVFSLISEVSSNAAVMPSISNALLYRTFEAISHHKQVKEIDYSYAPVNSDLLEAKPPVNYPELKKFEEKMNDALLTPNSIQAEEHVLAEPVLGKDSDSDLEDMANAYSQEEEESKDCRKDWSPYLTTRRSAALMKLMHYYKKEFQAMGVKLPLSNPLLMMAVTQGLKIAKDVIGSKMFRDKAGSVVKAIGDAVTKGKKPKDVAFEAANSILPFAARTNLTKNLIEAVAHFKSVKGKEKLEVAKGIIQQFTPKRLGVNPPGFVVDGITAVKRYITQRSKQLENPTKKQVVYNKSEANAKAAEVSKAKA